jgi:tRNA1Val (adenine37-N6)-methyltransferase
MANQWFKFKKFIIQQDKCAMKVGTDGVILGAWTSLNGIHSILDIGTGTGLLALMLAQRSSLVQIDAVELDADASSQAMQNVAESNFNAQIEVENQDFNVYSKNCLKKYDLILSNPPFFKDSLKPDDQGRKLARHNETLSLNQILIGAEKLLTDKGRLSLILPAELIPGAIDAASTYKLFPCRILNVIL